MYTYCRYMYMHACFNVLQFVTWLHIQIAEMLESGNEELQRRGRGTCIWYIQRANSDAGYYYTITPFALYQRNFLLSGSRWSNRSWFMVQRASCTCTCTACIGAIIWHVFWLLTSYKENVNCPCLALYRDIFLPKGVLHGGTCNRKVRERLSCSLAVPLVVLMCWYMTIQMCWYMTIHLSIPKWADIVSTYVVID